MTFLDNKTELNWQPEMNGPSDQLKSQCDPFNIVTKAWGKTERDLESKKLVAKLSLVDHCKDVATTAVALLRVKSCHRILGKLGKFPGEVLDEVTIQRLGVLAFLHDLGKANWGFQNKDVPGQETAGHIKEVISLFTNHFDAASKALGLDDLCKWGEAIHPLLYASLSHHGRPFNPEERSDASKFWQSRDGYDPIATLTELGVAIRQLFPLAFSETDTEFPTAPPFQHGFAGLMQLADWLGSHTDFFPISRNSLEIDANKAIAAVGLDPADARHSLVTRNVSFSSVFPFLPNHMQETVGNPDLGSLVILEAETGAGKTEAAIWRFKTLFESGEVDALYFALPTRVAATQIHDRVTKLIANMFPDKTRPSVVLAVPGYLKVDDVNGKILPHFKVLWADHSNNDANIHRRWPAEGAKRYCAATIAVGTIDQALLASLQVRHAHLRAFTLARSLLVVDEVHASDTYMSELLVQLIKNHRSAGGHVLLMSATLGGVAREKFLGATHKLPNLATAIAYPYPALTSEKGIPLPISSTQKDKHVTIERSPLIDDPHAIAQKALDAARQGAKVLIIRNTVTDAIACQQALETLCAPHDPVLFRCNGVVTLHHGRFARDDRKLLDKAVEVAIGKDRSEGGRIVIGTQTLEQSLDIDADVLYTDLCPIDVLLQRIGRLHRHQRNDRPYPFCEMAKAIILTPSERDLSHHLSHRSNNKDATKPTNRHGLGSVYDDVRVIEATWRLLEQYSILEIPKMNRELVEKATHPECLQMILEELGQDWRKHEQEILGTDAAERLTARLSLLDYTIPFDALSFSNINEKASTRLGLNNRLAEFSDPVIGPFSKPVHSIPIPGHLAKALPADAAVTAVKSHAGTIHFQFGFTPFRYDRMGLQIDRHKEIHV